jgi:hypothetical protein
MKLKAEFQAMMHVLYDRNRREWYCQVKADTGPTMVLYDGFAGPSAAFQAGYQWLQAKYGITAPPCDSEFTHVTSYRTRLWSSSGGEEIGIVPAGTTFPLYTPAGESKLIKMPLDWCLRVTYRGTEGLIEIDHTDLLAQLMLKLTSPDLNP